MRGNMIFYQGHSSPRQARNALVAVAVESALLIAGDDIYKKVSDLLMKTYGCEIMDCSKNPSYLGTVLSKLSEGAHSKVIEAIRRELGEYSYMKVVSSFLSVLDESVEHRSALRRRDSLVI